MKFCIEVRWATAAMLDDKRILGTQFVNVRMIKQACEGGCDRERGMRRDDGMRMHCLFPG